MKKGAEVHISGKSRAVLPLMVCPIGRTAATGDLSYFSLEFCYNIKHIDRNDRPERNPWSIRQVGVYERFDVITGQSVWIILRPSKRVNRRLQEVLALQRTTSDRSTGAIVFLHAAILIAAGREWGEYLEELREQIQRLV